MLFTVVIPNLHAPQIGAVVARLRAQTRVDLIDQIIVVGQDRYGIVPADVHFVATPRPLAAATVRNAGARLASGTHLLFLDADCLAAPDLIAQLAAAHQHGLPVVSGAVVPDCAGYWALCDNLLSFAPWLAASQAGERRYLPSLCLSIERDLFLASGGFDERFAGAAGEDTDLSLRLKARGARLFCEPAATVVHQPARSTPAAVWRHLRMFGRVQRRIQRHYPQALASPLARLQPRHAPLLLVAAPAAALVALLRLWRRYPAVRRFPHALPGMFWGQCAWFWGYAEALFNERRPEVPVSQC